MTGLFGWGSKNPKKGQGAALLKEFKSLAKAKRYDEALRCGSEYIRKVGDHHQDLFFTMGAICFVQKRYAAAISYFDRALEIGSYDVDSLVLKAKSHMIRREGGEAARCCKRIQEVDPDNEDAGRMLEELEKATKKGRSGDGGGGGGSSGGGSGGGS